MVFNGPFWLEPEFIAATHCFVRSLEDRRVTEITTEKELQLFSNMLPIEEKRITSEVCVHHLHFTSDDYARLGNQIKCNPAIKSPNNKEALWKALLDDRLDVIATDHAPHTWAEKMEPYEKAQAGLPLVQHAVPLMLKYVHDGILSLDKMVEKMNAHPWPIYKVKVGTEYDIEMITALRQHTKAPLRVDANAGWTTEEALLKIPALAKLGVELVEQPLAKDNWEGMKQLKNQAALPLFADESCVVEKDVAKCANFFDGINIKLTKCSGLTPALRMIKEAKSLGLKVMMGSMNESVIGSAAIAQFLPQLDYVDMDGPLLMTELNGVGLNYSAENIHGKIAPLVNPGLGVQYRPPFKK
jgi:L-alanine-DL-glutamate epimerase-like enolase superfamily enzyme